MAKRSKILNVREHLKHVQLVLDAYAEFGMCPLVEEELPKLAFYNKAILANHSKKREAGNRKDIYVEAES